MPEADAKTPKHVPPGAATDLGTFEVPWTAEEGWEFLAEVISSTALGIIDHSPAHSEVLAELILDVSKIVFTLVGCS